MHKLYLYTIRLLYPPRCTFCECILPLSVDELMCEDCMDEYPLIEEIVCEKCAKPIVFDNKLCNDCKRMIHSFEKGIALYSYKGIVQQAMYRFKYGGRRKYAQFFANRMYLQLKKTDFIDQIDLIIPVPISKQRRKERGYNQAEEIAKYLSKKCKIPYNNSILIRKRHTKPQSGYSPSQRRHNIKGAFGCIGELPYEQKSILIIDDIYTTGSTINECARALKKAGAGKIYSAVVCIGNPSNS